MMKYASCEAMRFCRGKQLDNLTFAGGVWLLLIKYGNADFAAVLASEVLPVLLAMLWMCLNEYESGPKDGEMS